MAQLDRNEIRMNPTDSSMILKWVEWSDCADMVWEGSMLITDDSDIQGLHLPAHNIWNC